MTDVWTRYLEALEKYNESLQAIIKELEKLRSALGPKVVA